MSDVLIKEIDILKINIQQIIKSKDPIIIEKRNKYLERLDIVSKNLQNIKKEITKTKEIKKVCMTNDSIKYNSVKNKPNSREIMNDIKINRLKAKENFEKTKEIENNYKETEIELDLKDYPGYCFLNKDIKYKYGLCPFIFITPDSQNIKENRIKWLSDQNDKGILYKNLYNRLLNKFDYNNLNNTFNQLNSDIIDIHSEIFSDIQQNIYNDIITDINEYKACKIKTKKIKDKFKIITNNISILILETGLSNIVNYLEQKFDLILYSNDLSFNSNHSKVIPNIIFIEIYNNKIDEYTIIKEKMIIENKYITNTIIDLKTQLNEYLIEMDIKEQRKKEEITYNGKYFKKWSSLNEMEQLDRYDSYSEFFVLTNLLKCNLIEDNEKDIEINKLKLLIKNNIKNIKFRNIKWNITKGIIEKIYILQYDDIKKECFIEIPKDIDIKPKKISSIKTILSKQNEKIINEELIKIIVKNKENNLIDTKTLKDNSIELLKIKLLVKRITSSDKILIFKKFDDIFTIITNDINSD